MKIGTDGTPDHPNADPNCKVCSGGGLLDDGDNYACWLVPCVCTGKATEDIKKKISSWFNIKENKKYEK